MGPQYDDSDFVDADYQATPKTTYPSNPPAGPVPASNRSPSREELESKVSDTQQRLSELKRAQEELERERAALEESRRRRIEFQTGREEMLGNLQRGIGILEEAEFTARRDAEQLNRSLVDLRDTLSKVGALRDEGWTQENWSSELTRALTTLENARMEWNSARIKWPRLDAGPVPDQKPENPAGRITGGLLTSDFRELCRIGLALTWPIALIAFLFSLAIILLLVRR